MNKGIDYGNEQTNIDPESGIRYGVISAHTLEWWYEESEAIYGEPTCPKCGNGAQDIDKAPKNYDDLPDWVDDGDGYCCLECKYTFEPWEAFGDEPLGWVYDQADGLEASQTQGDSDVWVIKSPFYTRAQFCSPCAPGACHLEHPMPEGEKAYCFGHEWFEGGKAPYPVYRVEDNSVVEPE